MPWSVMVIPTCLRLLNNAESYGLGYAAAAGTVGVAGCVLDFEALWVEPKELPHRTTTVTCDVGNYHESVNKWGMEQGAPHNTRMDLGCYVVRLMRFSEGTLMAVGMIMAHSGGMYVIESHWVGVDGVEEGTIEYEVFGRTAATRGDGDRGRGSHEGGRGDRMLRRGGVAM
ncbi:hypothetical protein B0H14DRAFT_2559159 [Mycena olivaceomarginata]|nr:hypothetical protein B0H14DRAFT_2559159 [Mycena olivaceomarginata]